MSAVMRVGVAHNGSTELKRGQEEATILCWTALLNIQLRASHEVAVCKPDEKPSGVQRSDVFGGHHDDVRDATQNRGKP